MSFLYPKFHFMAILCRKITLSTIHKAWKTFKQFKTDRKYKQILHFTVFLMMLPSCFIWNIGHLLRGDQFIFHCKFKYFTKVQAENWECSSLKHGLCVPYVHTRSPITVAWTLSLQVHLPILHSWRQHGCYSLRTFAFAAPSAQESTLFIRGTLHLLPQRFFSQWV